MRTGGFPLLGGGAPSDVAGRRVMRAGPCSMMVHTVMRLEELNGVA